MKVTRRGLIAGATAMAAATPFRAWSATDPRLAELYAAAKREGQLTWYIALITSEQAEQMGRAFSATYPGITVNVVRATGGVIYQKLTEDMRAQAHNCDVFSSSDIGQYISLGHRNLLMPYEPIAADGLRPLFRDYDKTHRIHVESTDFTTLAYHSKKVPAAEAPRRWEDLLDPKWSGKVAMAHPAYSGSMGTWTYEMSKMFGWQFFDKLAKNKPLVGRSLVDPVTNIISGERLVGIGPSDLILDQAAQGNPVRISYPDDGSIMMIGPVSIIQDLRHPASAKLFLEWLMGPEASKFSADQHRLPVCAAVAPASDVKTPDVIKIIQPNADELEKGIPDVIEKWRDTFGV